MSTSEPASPVASLLAALGRLPTFEGLVFRGLPEGVPAPLETVVTSGLTATSTEPDVALEGGAHVRLAAILSRTGRPLGPLSAHPELGEVVLLPGTLLSPVQTWTTDRGIVVHLLEELSAGDDALSGMSPQSVVGTVEELLRNARPVVAPISGKFAGPLT